MIDIIIDLINNNLSDIHNDEIILGLSQRIYKQSSDGIDFMPGIIDDQGEAIYAGIDDIKSLIIYHKANTANLTFLPRSGYGDHKENEDTVQCNCIIAWDSRKLKISNVDLLLLIRSRIPQEIIGLDKGISKITIIPTNANMNTKQIFDSEYLFDKEYLLPLYINFIQINYSIIIKYDQQCINRCINCN